MKTTQIRRLYEPLPSLDSIRVLKIYPGKDEEELRCRLDVIASDSSEGAYEAISYCWGDPSVTVEITCNGTSLPVTVSLADALRRFRLPDEERVLWADALCINQNNDEEKSHQVQRMHRVFHNAKKVLVWLGRDIEGISSNCFDEIRSLNRTFESKLDQSDIPGLYHPYADCVANVPWSHLETLLNHSWFKRSWVVQEVALARTCDMYWGQGKVSIEDLFSCFSWIFYSTALLTPESSKLIDLLVRPVTVFANVMSTYNTSDSWCSSRPILSKVSDRYGSKASFATVLDCARRLEAADDRDHIYAFIGSPHAQSLDGQPLVEVDYTKATEEVFTETAVALVQDPRTGPWLLPTVGHVSSDISLLPSWVPRWHKVKQTIVLGHPSSWYQAGGPIHLFKAVLHERRELKIQTVVFDKVVWMSKVLQGTDFKLNPEDWSEEVRETERPLLDTLLEETCQELSVDEDDFLSTLMAGFRVSDSSERDLEADRRYFEAYRGVLRSSLASPTSSRARADALWISDGIQGSSHNRRLVLTAAGRMGLAPDATKVGEICGIFTGVSVPMILRRSENVGRYRLVGESYIHGVMSGEILQQVEAGKFQTESILLV